LRIVDFSTHLSGPLASQLLRGLGAEVVKIENPRDGDGNRGLPPMINGQGMFHVTLNAGARSVAVSKRSPYWAEIVAAAAAWADVVVVGGRPEDVAKLGLAYDRLTAVNPTLVYCLISGYGERGPWRDYPAHGQQPDALAGLVPITWRDRLPETPAGWRSTGTTLAGVFAALGIMAAIHRRTVRSEAQYVAVSLWGCALWWNWRDLNTHAALGHGWPDYDTLGTRYAMYPTADERVLILCPIERRFWERLCDLLELPSDWRGRGRWDEFRMDFGTGPEYADERPVIAERIRTRTLDEWHHLLEAAGIPFAPVLSWAEAAGSSHAIENAAMRPTSVAGQQTQVASPPVTVSSAPGKLPTDSLPSAPDLGEHTIQFLRGLGLDEIADAAARGGLD